MRMRLKIKNKIFLNYMSSPALGVLLFFSGCLVGMNVRNCYKCCCGIGDLGSIENSEENSRLDDEAIYRFAVREAMRRSIENEHEVVEANVIERPREVDISNNYITAEAKYATNNVIVLDEK